MVLGVSPFMSEVVDLQRPVIRAYYVEVLGQLVEEQGSHREALLRQAGLPEARLNPPDTLLTVAEFVAACRAAIELTDDPALGIAFGQRLKFTSHGALAQAAISCATIDKALTLLARYFVIRFAYIDLHFFTEGEEAVIQLDLRHGFDDLYIFNVEAVMASLMDVNALLFGRRLMDGGSCRLKYATPEPDHRACYQPLFGDAVRFGQAANQLRFRRELLQLPVALHNPVTKRLAEAECEAELQAMYRHRGVAGRVRLLLEGISQEPLPGIEQVADKLHVSARTLRRQLRHEGAGFQSILDEVRAQRARWLLSRTDESIDVIAWKLGYSDASNFGRAFRKWEQVSPSVYRHQRASR